MAAPSSAFVASAVTGDPRSGQGGMGTSTSSGQSSVRGSGMKAMPSAASQPGPSSSMVADAVIGAGAPKGRKPPVPSQKMQKLPKVSPTMMGSGVIPHPGVSPPYPDARSPQPTLMPNGVPVMPPPTGFMTAGMLPRVPNTFAPSVHGMSALLGR